MQPDKPVVTKTRAMRQRIGLQFGMLLLLGLFTWWRAGRPSATELAQRVQDLVAELSQPSVPPGARLFSKSEIHAFLAQVTVADAITDPLQRCLAYPDPPGSHWSRDAVSAYCHYSFQKLISFAEIKALIDAGHADKLDQRMQQVLHQQSRTGSDGLLDHTFLQDFYSATPALRSTLDSWKQASPQSAFALAASGVSYVKAATEARGDDAWSRTSRHQLGGMNALLKLADADLQKAVALNPAMTPAYVAMIKAGRLALGRQYMHKAAADGLAIAPDDFDIYAAQMLAEQPRWGGSLSSMKRVVASAQQHVAQNPMLRMLAPEIAAYRYDVCNCQRRAVWSADRVVFDQLADVALLEKADYAARAYDHLGLSTVYLSEVIRFLPDPAEMRMHRTFDALSQDEAPWALVDANALVVAAPGHADRLYTRGAVYENMSDYPHAVADFRAAIGLDPGMTYAQIALGNIYVFKTAQWDQGWDVANELIRTHPEKPDGWLMRASVQKGQPRVGLDATLHYFIDHFGDDPSVQAQVGQMRADLASRAAAGASKQAARTGHG